MFQHLSAFRFNPVQLTWGATLFFTVSNIVLWQTLWANVDINSLHNVLFFYQSAHFPFLLCQSATNTANDFAVFT